MTDAKIIILNYQKRSQTDTDISLDIRWTSVTDTNIYGFLRAQNLLIKIEMVMIVCKRV